MSFSFPSISEEIESIAQKTQQSAMGLTTGVCFLPKESDDKPLGEDAFFTCDVYQTFGVADGVGGYAKDGIDSGIYAHELMENAWNFVLDHGAGLDPMDVLKYAFDRSEAAGASTACIMSLKDGFLHAVNVGDSGLLVIRSGKIVYKSPAQQSYFNCPFQLGGRNTPSDGDKIVVEVEKGDTVVAATDGLFDNVFLDEIEFDVKTSLESWCSPEGTALSLGNLARKLSLVDDEARPFTVAAAMAGLEWTKYLGGKYDDTTVVVGYIH